ncbi:type VI secretion system membrane subunit TssM [Belnapia sp. T6]|uniref:Type VI secretion system membrane subunit TssM n=1 Tax=Belnapia mucosa TaxID=2804532 RepID=A0ABS1V6Y7_9PROT|nr:type VI secretion system membrane subunit TssM [Belnapia mucosa]MBL6456921.1 type VI secretion system membrane subunit TssM [Belnapia mucosa]
MSALLSVLGSVPALAGLVAALALAAVFWVYGPLIGAGDVFPFEGFIPRLILASLPVIVFLVTVILIGLRRAKRDQALVTEAAAPDPAAQASAEEEAALREKLTTALAQLKQATGGKGGYLYELPWYVFIGPPGSGKTTAIAQSGLEFPLAEGKVSGVGGTRNCDWWLTDRAVLIDTAGRYTTQDSDAAADKAGWDRFLAMLRRNRPRQPLNGVLVCFGVDMLSKLDAQGRQDHARAVRKRIKELEEKLGQRLPVYLLISKADLLSGFTEFFDDLDKETRAQVWGMTFPVEAGPEGVAGKFAGEFGALLGRLQDRLLERLQAERGPSQRAAIMAFPGQVASLAEPVGAFAAAAFGGTRLDPAPMLRGVYLASGTQEGTPIDRLTGALSRAFGLDPRRPVGVLGQKGRSFFLGRLLREVVFNEARLAARDRGAERRRRMVAIAAWSLALVVTAGGLAWAYSAYNAEQRRAAALEEALAKAEGAGRTVRFDPVVDANLASALPYLDAAKPLPAAAHAPGGGLGLSQEAELAAGAEAAYRRVLDRVMLPRLLAGLEAQIRTNFQRADYLYEATRVYLMLGRQGPLDKPLVREWLLADWLRAFPGATGAPQREALLGHLDALLAMEFSAYPLDGALVDGARRVFSRLPMAERVYSRLRPLGQSLRPWTPAEALGPAGQRFFTRASGRPLTEGVPGLFTIDGLYRTLMPALGDAVRAAAAESWVLGPEARAAGAEDPARLEAAVLGLYAEDYARAWQTLLDDLVLPPFRNLIDAAEGLNVLGAPTSPIRDLLRAAARQLSPGTPPDGWAAPGRGAEAQRVQAAQGQAPAPTGAEPVAQLVETRFQALRTAAGQPLDGVLAIVNELYVQVARLASSPPGTVVPAPAAGLDPGQRLLAEAARQPQPLARWLTALGQSTATQRSGGAKAAIAAAGGQALGPVCRALGDPRAIPFPFRRDAAQDIPVDDFARLFGPGGSLDQFFAQWIRPYVDTTQKPWRLVATAGLAPPVTQADVQQFERAQAIRDAFFPGGAMMGGLRFELVPQGFDPNAQGAILEVEGTRHEMARGGPNRPIPLSWPTRGNVTLNFEPASSAGPLALDGGWSAFKLVTGRQAALQSTGQADRLRATVTQGDRSIVFELRTGSSIHPFGLRELQEFRCPQLAP